MTGPPDLAQAVGRRMRTLRDAHGVTADAVALQARRMGLGWQRSTVATIEAGRRRLTAEELLLLPLLLSSALPVSVRLRDLLDAEAALTGELVMTAAGFRQLLAEDGPLWGGYKLRTAPDAGGRRSSVEVWQRIERLYPDVHAGARLNLDRLLAVEQAAGGEAEQHAARALGCAAIEVSAVAHRLWGHGLTAERERRLAETAGPAEPGALRVRRGHVTRALVEEVSAAWEPAE